MDKKFEKRKNFLLDFFKSIDGLSHLNQRALLLYVSCEGFIGKTYGADQIIKDSDFVNFLLNNAKVAVVPGIAFGKSPYFRLSYATSSSRTSKSM